MHRGLGFCCWVSIVSVAMNVKASYGSIQKQNDTSRTIHKKQLEHTSRI